MYTESVINLGGREMNALFLLKSKATVALIYDNNTLRQGLEKMRIHGYTAIPVINSQGDYIGSISEGDFLWYMVNENTTDIKDLEDTTVINILRPGWNPAVRVDVSMEELLDRAMNQNFVPVVDDRNKFIGIITRKDILSYFANKYVECENEVSRQTDRVTVPAV